MDCNPRKNATPSCVSRARVCSGEVHAGALRVLDEGRQCGWPVRIVAVRANERHAGKPEAIIEIRLGSSVKSDRVASTQTGRRMTKTMIHWQVEARAIGIVITCRGHDRSDTVGATVRTFDMLMQKQPAPVVVVADLTEMTGYETSSRQAWQEIFRAHRKHMRCLVLVGARSKMIRMGAAVVGAFAAVPVRFVATWSELSTLDLSA
jgi:hypothetical protein